MLEMSLENARMILDIKQHCIIQGSCCGCKYDKTCEEINVAQSTIDILEWLVNARTVDSVKHGCWLENSPQIYTCSECDVEKFDPSNYCPNCGTKMDEVIE